MNILEEIREFVSVPELLQPLSPLPTLSTKNDSEHILSMPLLSSLSLFDASEEPSNSQTTLSRLERPSRSRRVKRKCYSSKELNKLASSISVVPPSPRLLQLVSRRNRIKAIMHAKSQSCNSSGSSPSESPTSPLSPCSYSLSSPSYSYPLSVSDENSCTDYMFPKKKFYFNNNLKNLEKYQNYREFYDHKSKKNNDLPVDAFARFFDKTVEEQSNLPDSEWFNLLCKDIGLG